VPQQSSKRAPLVRVPVDRDGKPLDNFRMVIPGDKWGARDANDPTTIAVE